MNAIGEEHPEGLRGGIDPKADPGKSGVAEGTDREQLAAGLAVIGIDVPAQTAARGQTGRSLRGSHQSNRLRLEDSGTFEDAAVEDHSGEPRQVGSGGEQSGVTGHAAHGLRLGIVNIATQNPARYKALVVEDKARRVANYHRETVKNLAELLGVAGLECLSQLEPRHINRRVEGTVVKTYAELYPHIKPHCLLQPGCMPQDWQADWQLAHSDRW